MIEFYYCIVKNYHDVLINHCNNESDISNNIETNILENQPLDDNDKFTIII